MHRAPAKPHRSTSTSSLPRRSTRPVAVVIALLVGGALGWALPALAGPGVGARATPVQTAGTFEPHTSVPALASVTTLASGSAPASGPAARSASGWGPPFPIGSPTASDLIAPLVTVSGSNGVAVGSGPTNEDVPADSRAVVLTAGANDVFSTQLMPPGAQETLAAQYLGRRLVLITGASGTGEACCSTASAQVADADELEGIQPLAAGLEGASTGVLVPVRGGLIAAVDNQAGITVARSNSAGVFSGTEPLVPPNPTPPLMAAGSLPDGGALVAFTAPASAAQKVVGTTTSPGSSTTASGYDQPRNRLIEYATAGPGGSPGAVKLAVTVPAGRQIDALQVIPHGAGVTLGWTESWFTANRYVSRVFWSDVSGAGAGPVRAISSSQGTAVGLSGAGSSAAGDLLSWQECDIAAGTCEVQSTLRPSGGDWGPVQSLGSVDPASFPVASQSRAGGSLIGWISAGVVYGAAAASGSLLFSPAVRVSGAHGASDLALSYGAGTRAAAVWVQGTFVQKLVGARFLP